VADSAKVPPADCVDGWLNVMVCGAAVTVMDLVTLVAAAYVPFPACAAVTLQEPAAIKLKVVPEIEQMVGVELLKLTAKPDDEEADKLSVAPTVWLAG